MNTDKALPQSLSGDAGEWGEDDWKDKLDLQWYPSEWDTIRRAHNAALAAAKPAQHRTLADVEHDIACEGSANDGVTRRLRELWRERDSLKGTVTPAQNTDDALVEIARKYAAEVLPLCKHYIALEHVEPYFLAALKQVAGERDKMREALERELAKVAAEFAKEDPTATDQNFDTIYQCYLRPMRAAVHAALSSTPREAK